VENQLRALVAPDADTVGWLGGAGILMSAGRETFCIGHDSRIGPMSTLKSLMDYTLAANPCACHHPATDRFYVARILKENAITDAQS